MASIIGRQKLVAFVLFLDQKGEKDKRRKTRERQVWCRDRIQRRGKGAVNQIERELETEDEREFANYFRMPSVKFYDLLPQIDDLISRKDTLMRDAIPPKQRLAVTLRFLALGEKLSH